MPPIVTEARRSLHPYSPRYASLGSAAGRHRHRMFAVSSSVAPRASVRCQATPVRASAGAFVSAAAAAILLATPAHAGVVLAENPGVKKFGDAPAAKTEEPKKAEKKQDGGEVGEGIDVRLVAFPLSLIGAASVLLIPGVSNTVAENAIKDSAVLGAGFEVAIKEGQVASGGARKGNGTMKVKGGAKKGLF